MSSDHDNKCNGNVAFRLKGSMTAFDSVPNYSFFLSRRDKTIDVCKAKTPSEAVEWLIEKGIEHDASPVTMGLLDKARGFIEGETIINQEQFNTYLDHAHGHIQQKIAEKDIPKIELAKKFKDNKRGKGKVTACVDEELEKILMEIGTDAQVYDPEDNDGKSIFSKVRIMVENKNGHPVFEDVGLDIKTNKPYILARNPQKISQKRDFTVSAIKKRIAPIIEKLLSNR